MARLKHKLSEAPAPPERGVKAATFKLLLDTAMDIIRQSGHIPSVAEAAARAKVSRATAYRYFPSRSALITAVVDSSLGPVRRLASDNPNGRERVHELFVRTFPRFKEFEAQMRAAAQLSLEQWGLERAGLLEEEPYRRGHRVRILECCLPDSFTPVRSRNFVTKPRRSLGLPHRVKQCGGWRAKWEVERQRPAQRAVAA